MLERNQNRVTSYIHIILLIAVIISSVLLRCWSAPNFANPEGGFFFYGIDAYDHLRRIMLGMQSFPVVPGHDYYVGYPQGTGQIWPPLYDYIISTLCVMLNADRALIETICFFANPFYSAIGCLLVFIIGSRIFNNQTAGVLAAFLFAIFPGHVSYSLPMNFDHHVFEPLVVLLLFGLVLFERDRRLDTKSIILCSLIIVLTVFMWRGATLYWGVLFVSTVIRSLANRDFALSKCYAIFFGFAAILISFFCIINPWDNANSFSFNFVSWFHVFVLFAACVSLAIISYLKSIRKLLITIVAISLLSIVMVALSKATGNILAQFSEAFVFLQGGATDPWLKNHTEYNSVFFRGDFLFSATYLTVMWFLTPFCAVHALKKWFTNESDNDLLLLFVLWSPIIFLGYYVRYTIVAGIFTSFAAAYIFSHLFFKYSVAKRTILSVLLVTLCIAPAYTHYAATIHGGLPKSIKSGLYDPGGVLHWMSKKTPKTSYYLNPVKFPEYSVLANWDLGARIYYLAKRPAVATAFGWETYGMYEYAAFTATTRPDIAEKIINKNNARYIILKAYVNANALDETVNDGVKRGMIPYNINGNLRSQLSMYNRLMKYDGTAFTYNGQTFGAASHYRLAFESDLLAPYGKQDTISYYKVFEYVPGATISGQAAPNQPVSISLQVITSRNRSIFFVDRTITDAGGRYKFLVPYATSERGKSYRTVGPYYLSATNFKVTAVQVSEDQILQGKTISID